MIEINADICDIIIDFLLDPPILIKSNKYDINGNIELITERDINSIIVFKNKIKNVNSEWLEYITNSILIQNKKWLLEGNIYFGTEFIFNEWKKTYLYKLDNSKESLSNYSNEFFTFLRQKTNNITYLNNISEYLEKLKQVINEFNNKIKISELQFRMRYINIYFKDYLILINQDLNQFKVNDLLEFINTEENILYNLID